jgi:cytidylate kinase
MAVITFSRQYGSRGDEVAARVREMLGYRLFDKRLMAQVASEIGLSDNEIVDFSERNYKVRGFLERLFARRSGRVVAEASTWTEDATGARTVEVAQLDEEQCVGMVKATIRAAYKQGNVVIVGRGGQAILSDMRDVLHVRIEAPLSKRIQHVHYHEMSGLAPEFQHKRAEQLVAERDRAAAAYLKRFFDIEWDDSSLYHLVINTARCSTETAAHIVANAVSYLPTAEPQEEDEPVKVAA